MDTILEFLRLKEVELSPKLMDGLRRLNDSGKLSVGWSDTSAHARNRTFLTWRPLGLDERTTTAIVSSRLGRQLDRRDAFFRVLRIACSQLDPRRQMLISAKGTVTHPFVTRAAELFGLDVLEVQVASSKSSLENWIERCSKMSKTDSAWQISPPFGKLPPHPFRDQIPIESADQVLAIYLREKGNTLALLQQKLELQTTSRVYLAFGDNQLVTQKVAEPLMKRGAIGWMLLSPQDDEIMTAPLSEPHIKTDNGPSIISLKELASADRFLTHCTRGTNGPWPDQTLADFLDELILGEVSRDRSALASLMRILGQCRILATGDAIRESKPVVSFTAVELHQLSSLRRYRSHRGRWDFEPYGVAIDRDYLISVGARPVLYGDESIWSSLPIDDRPFFQKLGEEENSIDWRVEQEFRVMHDVELDPIPSDQVVIFVPTREEAKHVAKISRWTVVVMSP